ncbi:MAG: PorT family protein [Saprospiraceae bacterium]|nr:PorT family protein [Saprospiraceae bacterium]
METVEFRHMHNIHWRQIIFFALLITSTTLSAQVRPKGNYNYWDFQKKPFYFGLTLGTHSTGYLVEKSRAFTQTDSIRVITGLDKPGLNVNIITNLKIGEYFDFRFIPGFAFSERRFRFSSPTGVVSEKKIESVFLEIPLLLRFKSAPYKDKRLFVVGGLKYSYDVASNSSVRQEQGKNLIQIAPHDFQFEVGAGMQFFFPFFIFSPEIKYSQGIGNIHIFNGFLEESTLLDRVLSRTLSISFHFEG